MSFSRANERILAAILAAGFGLNLALRLAARTAPGQDAAAGWFMFVLLLTPLVPAAAVLAARELPDKEAALRVLPAATAASILYMLGGRAGYLSGPPALVFLFMVPGLALATATARGFYEDFTRRLAATLLVLGLLALAAPMRWSPAGVAMLFGGLQMLLYESFFGTLRGLALTGSAGLAAASMIIALRHFNQSRDPEPRMKLAAALAAGALLLVPAAQGFHAVNQFARFGVADLYFELMGLCFWCAQIIPCYLLQAGALERMHAVDPQPPPQPGPEPAESRHEP